PQLVAIGDDAIQLALRESVVPDGEGPQMGKGIGIHGPALASARNYGLAAAIRKAGQLCYGGGKSGQFSQVMGKRSFFGRHYAAGVTLIIFAALLTAAGL